MSLGKKVKKVFKKAARIAALASLGPAGLLASKKFRSGMRLPSGAEGIASASGIAQRVVGSRQGGEGVVSNISGFREEGVV